MTMVEVGTPERFLRHIFDEALAAVDGRPCVREALQRRGLAGQTDWAVLAVGKAAEAMLRGALDVIRPRRALLITKRGYLDRCWQRGEEGVFRLPEHPAVRALEAAHPVPDESSLRAGAELIDFLCGLPESTALLCLISGGASSLVEAPVAGVDATQLARITTWLIGSGLGIEDINRVRRRLSRLKDGRMLDHVGSRRVLGLLISDVPDDAPAVIASGLLCAAPPAPLPELPDFIRALLPPSGETRPVAAPVNLELEIVANLERARRAAERAAAATVAVHCHAPLYGDYAQAAHQIAHVLRDGPTGLHLWGGEPAVVLPAHPGQGGRNQQLALAVAGLIRDLPGRVFLAAGTDGSDGPTEVAGACVSGDSARAIEQAGFDLAATLEAANAGPALRAAGALVATGPTGSNVMDLHLGLKTPCA